MKPSSRSTFASVCFLIAHIRYGGAARATVTLANELAKKGVQVSVVTHVGQSAFPLHEDVVQIGLFDEKEIKSDFLNKIWRRIAYLNRLQRAIRSLDSDVIVGVMWSMATRTWILGRVLGKLVYVTEHTIHSRESTFLSNFARKLVYRWVDRVVVLTQLDLSHYELYLRNVIKIPNIVNLEFDKIDYGIVPDPPVIFAVTDFSRWEIKGLDYLLTVYEKILEKYPRATLRIACARFDCYEYICSVFGNRIRDPRVKILGFLGDKELAREYGAATVFVMTSRYEGFSLVLAEAMTVGAAVVSFDCPYGPREIITSGLNGVLVPESACDQMASEIELIISSDSHRLCLKRNALIRSVEFSSASICTLWLNLLRSERAAISSS